MEALWTSVLGVLPLGMEKGEIKAIADILGEVPESASLETWDLQT